MRHWRIVCLLALVVANLFASTGSLDLEKAREHWAYRLPRKAGIPAVRDESWPRGTIDRFILERIEERNFAVAPDASRERLVRRLYFDLIGLPPTPEEIDWFVADRGERATENLVDRLLASPHFGERWGRHWLDVARYAESVTLRGLVFKEAWRYRDYVIESFNRDLPFDDFIQEQLAGDLLERGTLEEKHRARVATTFLVLGNFNYEEQDKEQLRMDIVDEQLDTIGKAFLGQTLGCARCHDHKFDPIPARDYYAMAGILRNTKSAEDANVSTWIEVPLPVTGEEDEKIKQHETKLAELQRQVRKKTEALTQAAAQSTNFGGLVIDDSKARKVGVWKASEHNKPFIGEGYHHDDNSEKGAKTVTFLPELENAGKFEVRLAYTSGENRATKVPVTILHAGGETVVYVNQRVSPPIAGHFVSLGQFHFERGNQGSVLVSNAETDGHVIVDAVQFLPADESSPHGTDHSIEVAALRADLEALRQEVKRLTDGGTRRPMAMSVKELEKCVDSPIHIRGSVHRLGEVAPRGFLQVADYDGPRSFSEKQSGRKELAEWIASERNPLTARVMANRIWHWLMGAGLARSTDNFGTTGDRPTHPELLDYLAIRFVESGWSIKQIVREIVLSRTYQLSTGSENDADPENRALARANRKRLEAEALRDAMLLASGELKLVAGGVTVRPGTSADYGYLDESTRRSVYVPAFRNALPQIFELFDFADTSVVSGQRNASVVAPQALFFLNHPFVLERSRVTAERIQAFSSEPRARVERAYRLILGRKPTEVESTVALEHVSSAAPEAAGWAEVCQALFASPEFRFLN